MVLWVAVAAGVAWIPVAIVLFAGDGDEPLPSRSVDVAAGAEGCAPHDFNVKPGERVIFRVTNSTDSDFEVIVTDEGGVALRTSPDYQPGDPIPGAALSAGLSLSGVGLPGVPQDQLAHEGHGDEVGPNATEDFRYRMIVAENGVRIMAVTFPEVGEFAPFTRFICAAVDSEGNLDDAMRVGVVESTGATRD